ncbi:hypothetical protein [Streptomyces poonensis]|uniref:Uncharacterized protein n=1 Tax=Streptomyces poonensis TaxID=68255 RepID=A0A918UG09_9ACTN|nr:hypothetical protein [Streptomyces poonensis]GGZ02468.1 hypothetical protein GCM10010365_21490 [Streptomyces poonensis]GLJ93229.1 hypothetical protein GCM10017589_58410 [Streptomyces poonensis]
MPTYEQLYHLNLGNLAAAADRWEETATKFKGLHTAYGDQVARPFRQACWSQPVLTAAKADNDVRAAQEQFESAQKQAQGIAGVLTSLHAELKKAKEDLRRLADVEAEEQDLHVGADGTVTPRYDLSQDAGARHDPDGQAAAREQQQACEAFARRIEGVLRQAAEADEIACWALRRDLGSSKSDFNSKVVTSLDAAGAARAAELKKKDASTKTDGWVAEGETEVSGLGAGTSVTGPDTGSGKLGEAAAHADLGRASAEGSLTNGPMRLEGAAEAYAGAKASASGGITDEGIAGEAGAFAGAEASANGRADAGPVGVYGRAEGMVGAEANVTAGVGVDGVQLGAEAFAGAKGSVSGGADIGGIGVGATAEGWAGPGAEASLNFSKDANGAWHWAPKVGISPLLGGAVGFEVTVDPGKIADTAGSAADAVGDAAGWFADGVGSLF